MYMYLSLKLLFSEPEGLPLGYPTKHGKCTREFPLCIFIVHICLPNYDNLNFFVLARFLTSLL